MKTREKMVVLLAFALSLGVSSQVWGFGTPELDVNNNDVQVAQDQATTANDGSAAVGSGSLNNNDVLSNNDYSHNVDVNKEVDVDVKKDVDVLSNNDNSKNIDVSKEVKVDVDKTATQNGSKNEAEGKGNAAANNSSTSTVDNTDNSDNSKTVTLTATKTETETVNVDKSKTATDSFNKNVEVKEDSFNDNSKVATDSFNDTATDSFKKVEAEKGSAAAQNGDATNDSYNKSIEVEIEDSKLANDSFNGNIDDVKGGMAASTGGSATMENSYNTDNSDHNSAGDNGIVANDEAEIDANYDSNNRNEAEKGSAANYGSGSASIDNSKNNSFNTTTEITVGNVDVEVAFSQLEGTVSGNSINTPPSDNTFKTGDNCIRAELTTNGISVLSQNSGVDSLVQQSVNVQVNK